jgi:hypothetical protein
MSVENSERVPALPILFFAEDPDEIRIRVQGARPAPASIRVPRLAGSGSPEPDAIEYPLLQQAGAPVEGGCSEPTVLAELGAWVQRWFPVLAASLVEQRFLTDSSDFRLGRAFAVGSPQRASRAVGGPSARSPGS